MRVSMAIYSVLSSSVSVRDLQNIKFLYNMKMPKMLCHTFDYEIKMLCASSKQMSHKSNSKKLDDVVNESKRVSMIFLERINASEETS